LVLKIDFYVAYIQLKFSKISSEIKSCQFGIIGLIACMKLKIQQVMADITGCCSNIRFISVKELIWSAAKGVCQ